MIFVISFNINRHKEITHGSVGTVPAGGTVLHTLGVEASQTNVRLNDGAWFNYHHGLVGAQWLLGLIGSVGKHRISDAKIPRLTPRMGTQLFLSLSKTLPALLLVSSMYNCQFLRSRAVCSPWS